MVAVAAIAVAVAVAERLACIAIVRGADVTALAGTKLGQLALLHLHPMNLMIQLVGLVGVVWGLWQHESLGILGTDVDLIISDYRMPGISGIEFLGILARDGIDVPLIMLTGYASIEHAVSSIKAGAVDSQAVEGARNLHYSRTAHLCEWVPLPAGIPVGYWRSVGASINAFAVERLMDKLAKAVCLTSSYKTLS